MLSPELTKVRLTFDYGTQQWKSCWEKDKGINGEASLFEYFTLLNGKILPNKQSKKRDSVRCNVEMGLYYQDCFPEYT